MRTQINLFISMSTMLLTGIIYFSSIPSVHASNSPPVSIVISQGVQKREPVGPTLSTTDHFKLVGDKIYAWTRLQKKVTGNFIHHVWYFQDNVMDDIKIPIAAQMGRMHSVKTIRKPYIGVWRVEVLQEDKKLLESSYFAIDLIDGKLCASAVEGDSAP